MKVNRRSDNRGATLILNEQELEYLWHKLNCADGNSFTNYKEEEKYISEPGIGFIIWNTINEKYSPKKTQ